MKEGDLVRIYDYNRVPTVRHFVLDDSRITAIQGPFGSGKSVGCVMKIIKKAHEQKPSPDGIRRTRFAVIRNTYTQLKDTTMETLKYWLPFGVVGTYIETNKCLYVTEFPGVYCEIIFRALDQDTDVRNLLSLELTGAWINEYREVNKKIFEALDGRHGRYPPANDGGCSWNGIFMDTNPPLEGSYWYKLFEEKRPRGYKLYKQPSGLSHKAENLQSLPKGYYEDLANGKEDDFVNVFVHGNYGKVISGIPIYTDYNDSLHVASQELQPMPDVPLILGFDFGLNPSAVICQVSPRGQLRVLDEITGIRGGLESMLDNFLLPLLSKKYQRIQKLQGAGDPTGNKRADTDETSCYDVLTSKKYKLDIVPARTNALLPRVNAVESFLRRLVDGSPAIIISPTCKILRQGFNGGYRRKRIKGTQDMYGDEPDKNEYSHIHDALQYACMFIMGGVEMEDKRTQVLQLINKRSYRPADMVAGF
jgi:hypothetical protein